MCGISRQFCFCFCVARTQIFGVSLVMRFILKALTVFVAIFGGHSVDLSCEFGYSRQDGYFCKAVNFTNTNRHEYVSGVIGSHLYPNDRRRRSHASVVRLAMYDLPVHYLPGNLTELFPLLRVLQVKKCGLKALTRGEELRGLRGVYFGFNQIDRVPVNYFWHFCKLEMLSLYGNRISSIPKMAFRDLKSLKRLSLSGNRLREIAPSTFRNCTNLEFVDLDRNHLELIDNDLFANLTKLRRVNLRYNKLSSIGNDFLSTLVNLKFALFLDNSCINASFPETPLDRVTAVFRESCSPNITTTTVKPKTTAPPRKKPKYKKKKAYEFDNCEWKTPPGHRYF